jgi:HD domain
MDLANPYALSAILNTSAEKAIVASEDIVDEHGVKLWAKDKPVSHSLQQRLLERKLRQPLESCLRAVDGVTVIELHRHGERLLAEDEPLSPVLAPWAHGLLQELRQMPLHPAVQLLLTTAQSTQPRAFEHALRSMLLAGALALYARQDHAQVRLALLGGLLHDLGELYVNPDYLNPEAPLSPAAYRHLLVHPRIGSMLLNKLTDYPADLARAVGEHHERLDGSGYPARLQGAQISSAGMRLAFVEMALGVLGHNREDGWDHISLAARLVPGEFDATCVAFASQAARLAPSVVSRSAAQSAEPLENPPSWGQAQDWWYRLEEGQQRARQLAHVSTSERVCKAAAHAEHLLERLLMAASSLGLWAPQQLGVEAGPEVQNAARELAHRLSSIRRLTAWTDAQLTEAESQALEPLWGVIEPSTQR